jgi:tetratricopeptide (TPR) repeat protein
MMQPLGATRAVALMLALAVALLAPVRALAVPAEDETAAERGVQRARRASAVGAVDEAIRIYNEVLAEDPGNDRAFWGLVRLYSSAGMEEEALIPMLERRLEEQPENTQVKMELGLASAKVGDHDRAHELWSDVLADGPPDAGRYSDIGTLEVRHGMHEHALRTFMAGRGAFHSESLFSQELTTVYTALGDFSGAIDECFATVNNHRGAVSWATNRIELMLEEGAKRGEIRAKMATAAGADDATVAELSLAGGVYLVLDLPERALKTFLRADEIAGGHGSELLEYAMILGDEGFRERAREAYLMVVERHPGTASAARAGTAAAGILAEMGDPAGAVLELRSVAHAFGGSSRGAQALFEAARVELDVLKDPGAALATIAELRERFGDRALRMNDEAILIEVDAYMKQGRLDEAHERSTELTREGAPDDIRESAMFALGFISFLKHDHTRAVEEFRAMIEADAAGVLVNDALRLMLVIANAEEAGDSGPVDLLADAHAARIRGDDKSSRELLELLSNRHTGEAVEAEALLLLGAAATVADEPRRAISYYERIVEGTEAITARAEAMMRTGDLLSVKMGRTSEAMDVYLAILEDLPPNILSGEARRKLDGLRRQEGAPE